MRQQGGAVMVSVSWGSKGEINATRPSLCFSDRQERHGNGEGRTVGWKDEDMEKSRGKLVRSLSAAHTRLHTCVQTHQLISVRFHPT